MAASPCRLALLVLGLSSAASFWTGCQKSSANPASGNEAPITFEKNSLDLGEIAEGDAKIGQTIITNVSAFPVTIDRVSATCGCTKAEVTEDKIPPGGKAVLNVELAPQGRRGPFGSTVTVEWTEQRKDESRQGKIEVSAQAKAVFLVGVSPSFLDFGAVETDSAPVEKTIALVRGTQKLPFEELKISSDSAAVQTRVEKRDKDSWTIFAKLLPNKLPSGPSRATLTAAFFDGVGEEVAWRELSARAEIIGLVSVKPKSLFFGVLKPGEKREGLVAFTIPHGRNAAFKRVYTQPEVTCLTFSGEKDFVEKDGFTTLKVSVDTAGKTGDQSGKIFVEFMDESLGSISVPFILHVK